MKDPTKGRFPIGLTCSIGGLDPSALTQAGATVDGPHAKNGLGGAAVVGDPLTTAGGHGWLDPTRNRRRDNLSFQSHRPRRRKEDKLYNQVLQWYNDMAELVAAASNGVEVDIGESVLKTMKVKAKRLIDHLKANIA